MTGAVEEAITELIARLERWRDHAYAASRNADAHDQLYLEGKGDAYADAVTQIKALGL